MGQISRSTEHILVYHQISYFHISYIVYHIFIFTIRQPCYFSFSHQKSWRFLIINGALNTVEYKTLESFHRHEWYISVSNYTEHQYYIKQMKNGWHSCGVVTDSVILSVRVMHIAAVECWQLLLLIDHVWWSVHSSQTCYSATLLFISSLCVSDVWSSILLIRSTPSKPIDSKIICLC